MKLIRLHYNWQQNRTGKIGDIFQSVPKIKQMKAHKVCILWSLLILPSIPYEKNMHGNTNDDFFLA